MDDSKTSGVPEYIPVVSRTSSDELTKRMFMIDHRLAKMEGPPDPPFEREEDTEVDAVVVDVEWR